MLVRVTDELKGSVPHVQVKRGYKELLITDTGQSILLDGEMGFCIDTKELYVGYNGNLFLLASIDDIQGGGGSGGGGTLTGAYVELVTTDGSKYRVTMTDEGRLNVINSLCDTATPATPSLAGNFLDPKSNSYLIINKVYGGGVMTPNGLANANATLVSHAFIELYNMSPDKTFNLKGLAIQVAVKNQPWQIWPLRGEVKPGSSFLIRGAEYTDPLRKAIQSRGSGLRSEHS